MCMYLSLGGDRALLSALHYGSSRKINEFALREIITNFPSTLEVTEPSVTWQSEPGNRPLRFIQVNDLLILLAGVFT